MSLGSQGSEGEDIGDPMQPTERSGARCVSEHRWPPSRNRLADFAEAKIFAKRKFGLLRISKQVLTFNFRSTLRRFASAVRIDCFAFIVLRGLSHVLDDPVAGDQRKTPQRKTRRGVSILAWLCVALRQLPLLRQPPLQLTAYQSPSLRAAYRR
jgi:hypothetical protein